MKKTIVTTTLTLALAASSSAALAASGEGAAALDAVRVSYADLNLQNAHDSAVMTQRLSNAAMEVCGASSFSLSEYRWAVAHSDCYKTSMARAVSDMHALALGPARDIQARDVRVFASN